MTFTEFSNQKILMRVPTKYSSVSPHPVNDKTVHRSQLIHICHDTQLTAQCNTGSYDQLYVRTKNSEIFAFTNRHA